jgi:hypothetical protein
MRVPRIRQDQRTSGISQAIRYDLRDAERPRACGARKGSRNASFWKPSRSLIDICHMRYDDEVRR